MYEELKLSEHQTLQIVRSSPAALVLESRWAPGGPAPRTHWHPTQHERFDVLQGELTVHLVGDSARTLQPGQSLEIPPRTAHRMWNAGADVARARWTITPRQRSEEMFARLAREPSLIGSLIILWRHRHEIRLGGGSLQRRADQVVDRVEGSADDDRR